MTHRRCDTCLYYDKPGKERSCCHHANTISGFPSYDWWCSLWEPRDRSLVRCETCEWWDHDNEFGLPDERVAMGLRFCLNVGASSAYVILEDKPTMALTHSTRPEFRCSAWRLREEL